MSEKEKKRGVCEKSDELPPSGFFVVFFPGKQ